jgi:transcriptional regulator with XRE-family HTH domain
MHEEIFIISGKKLRAARKRLRPALSQETFGDKIGVSRATANVWEQRESVELDSVTFKAICKILKVSPDDLIYQDIMPARQEQAQTIDIDRAIEKYDSLYKETISSQKQFIDELRRDKEALAKDKENLWQHIQDLTKSFGSLQKAK